jgi:cytochrome c biogenesis protein CcmG/thiol:disulfide interchange protein DsbE
MPDLQATWEGYRERGVTFVGVAYQDELANVQAALREFGTTYPVGLDQGDKLSTLYGITGVPETFVVGRDGRVAYVHIGPVTEAVLSAELDNLLGAP